MLGSLENILRTPPATQRKRVPNREAVRDHNGDAEELLEQCVHLPPSEG
jgi:hypothetical protein